MPGILVVEDDENLNRGITFSLKKSGYEVFSAESVKKAKRIASDNNVDVTICDVNLPDGNGLEFVRWMRCCLLYTSPSPRDPSLSRMPSSA